jgi:PAS domain S-box-containing protein
MLAAGRSGIIPGGRLVGLGFGKRNRLRDAGGSMEQSPFSSSEYVELFFDLFETSSDAVYIIRVRDGIVLEANESALSMWGVGRGSAIGRNTLELGLWATPDEREAFIQNLRQAGRVRGYPVRFRTPWSEEFTVYLTATLAHLRGEDVILGVGVLARPNEGKAAIAKDASQALQA